MSALKKFSSFLAFKKFYRSFAQCAGKKGLVLGVYTTEEMPNQLSNIARQFDEKTDHALCKHLESLGEPLAFGESTYLTNVDPEFFNICLVGAGCGKQTYNKLEEINECKENARFAAGCGVRILRDTGIETIAVEPFTDAAAAAEGAQLALWQYQEFRSQCIKSPNIELFNSDQKNEWESGIIRASCQNIARELSEAPANHMTPLKFAQAASDILCPCGVEMEIRDKDWIEGKKMNAFLSVARGSCEPPVLLEIGYCGGPVEDSPIVLIGKGTTFNTGGICLYDSQDLHEMRADMSGAAVVVAIIKAAVMLSLPINIRAVIPLCENMPSGMALKPGDVVESLSGKTILVEDTAKEGVLMLADALTYAQDAYKPKLVLDVATLSSGVKDCIGSGATAVFTNDDELWTELSKAGMETGDRLWRLPLWKHFTDKVTSGMTTDLSNVGFGRGGSPCIAAAFLNEFIQCVDWAHFDTRGTGMMSFGEEIPYLEHGRMTGRPMRTILQFLYQITCCIEENQEKLSIN